MKNATFALIGKILVLLCAYASRVVFVHVLSQSVAGANGLLTSTLGVFSLISLGIDTALCYQLYKPVAEGDYTRQRLLMRVYNKVHLITGGVVTVISVIMFFMMRIISPESFEIPNFALIYWLFAGNVIFGYILSHKPMIFIATQQNYINEIFESVQLIAQYAVQIVVLLLTKSFVLFTVIYFLSIVIKNILANSYANRKYPYLKEHNNPLPDAETEDGKTASLSVEDKKEIRKNLWAILVQKFGVKIINYTDAIILSSFYGLESIAKFTTYHLVLDSVKQLLEKVVNSVTGSIGNLSVMTDKDAVETVYNAALFITAAMFGVISVCMFHVFDLFVELSFGSEYVYQTGITLVLCINLYLNGIRAITTVFRNSLGLFWNDRYRSIIEAVANIIFSLGAIFLFKEIGIFLGTTLSMIAVPLWIEPLVLYKRYFNKPLYVFFVKFFIYTVVIGAAGFASYMLCGLVGGTLILRMILRLVISFVVTCGIIVICFFRTKEFGFLIQSVKDVLWKKKDNKQ